MENRKKDYEYKKTKKIQNRINKNKEKIHEYYEKYKRQIPEFKNKDSRRKQKDKVLKLEKEKRTLWKNSKI